MDRKAHNFITKYFLGVDYDWIHALKDRPVATLGFKHKWACHDDETALLLTLISGDLKVYFACVLHDACDKVARDARKALKEFKLKYVRDHLT